MPPTQGTRHIDAALADVSIAHMQSQDDALYGNVVPSVSVEKDSDKYFTFPTGTWNKRQARRRAAGDKAALGGYTVSNDSYQLELYSVAHKDPRESQSIADDALDPEIENTEWAAGQVLMEADALIATAIMAPSVWDTDLDGAASGATLGTSVLQWDQSASDPITDVAETRTLVKKACTKDPNVGVCGRSVWDRLINHPAISDRIKHVSKESITPDMVAKLFQLDKLVVPGLTQNTAELGQTASMDFIFNAKDFGLFYVPPTVGKRTLCAAKVFAFNGGEYKEGHRVATWYEEDTNSDYVQVDLYIDVKIVASSAGAFIDDVIA